MAPIDVIGGSVLLLTVLVGITLTAPVHQQEVTNGHLKDPIENIDTQEQELENLIQLAQHPSSSKDEQKETSHVTKIENINGHQTEIQQTDQKYISPKDGKLLSQVTQEVNKVISGHGKQPETVVETEVSIPSAGIHESFVESDDDIKNENNKDEEEDEEEKEIENLLLPTSNNDGNNNDNEDDANDNESEDDDEINNDIMMNSNGSDENIEDKNGSEEDDESSLNQLKHLLNDDDDDDKDTIDNSLDDSMITPMTTQDMAQYLYLTQQYDQFFPALDKLVEMNKLSSLEAAIYARDVIKDYDVLTNQLVQGVMEAVDKRTGQDFYQPNHLGQRRQEGAWESADAVYPDVNGYEYPAYDRRQSEYNLLKQQSFNLDTPQLPQQQHQPYYLMDGGQVEPLELMTSLYDTAYAQNNPQARDVMQYLFNQVGNDDNHNEVTQIKDLLNDVVGDAFEQRELPVYHNNQVNMELPYYRVPGFGPQIEEIDETPFFIPKQGLSSSSSSETQPGYDDIFENGYDDGNVDNVSDESNDNQIGSMNKRADENMYNGDNDDVDGDVNTEEKITNDSVVENKDDTSDDDDSREVNNLVNDSSDDINKDNDNDNSNKVNDQLKVEENQEKDESNDEKSENSQKQ